MTTCNTCHQTIQLGEMSRLIQGTPNESWAEHTLPHDCVAATARRCAEIAKQYWTLNAEACTIATSDESKTVRSFMADTAALIRGSIRREFPAAFVSRVEEGK